MADFLYTAADAEGKMIRGTLSAANRHDLIAKLQQRGFFLVSSSEVAVHTPFKFSPEASPPDPEPAVSTDNTLSVRTTFWTKKRQRLLLTVLLLALVDAGWRAHRSRQPHFIDTHLLNQKLGLLRPEMKRTEVEQIFGAAVPGSPGADKTWYFVPPEFIVEVAYDVSKGTSGLRENRIKWPGIRILKSRIPGKATASP